MSESEHEGMALGVPVEMAPPPPPKPKRRLAVSLLIVLGILVLGGLGYGWLTADAEQESGDDVPTVKVLRGPLTVMVRERGAIWSMEPVKMVNEVEGRSTILEIVDEGTIVTEQDVADKKVLVRMDTSGLEEQEADRRISVFKAKARYTQATEDREIRIKQNESDVADAELKARFAEMDLDRYVGSDLAPEVNADFDFNSLADDERLGGRARQEVRDRDAAVLLAKANLADREETVGWTVQLEEKGFVERTRLETDKLLKKKAEVRVMEAVEDLRLFKTYTLPKEAEKAYADYVEAERHLVRIRAQAVSRQLQADAGVKSTEANYKLAQERLAKTERMIKGSTLVATVPGRVIYGGATDPMVAARAGAIEEGAELREGDVVFRIPDLTKLAARINIRETVKDDVHVGQPATMTLDATPGRVYTGKVARVSPMASAEHAWLNPDAKVYQTDVALDAMPEGYIPGMSARVQITVAELKNVLYVPAQCIVDYKNLSYCWMKTPDGPKERVVEKGHMAEEFTEVVNGLTEDEEVYLAPPGEPNLDALNELVEIKKEQDALKAEERAREEAARKAKEAMEGGGAPQYVVDGQINWQVLGAEMRKLQGLSEEEREKKRNEILSTLPEAQRAQVEEMIKGRQEGDGQEGGQGSWGGRGGGRRGGGEGGRRGGGGGGGRRGGGGGGGGG